MFSCTWFLNYANCWYCQVLCLCKHFISGHAHTSGCAADNKVSNNKAGLLIARQIKWRPSPKIPAKVNASKTFSVLSLLSLMLLTSSFLPLRLWLMDWALLVDSLPASSVGIITSTADGQHDPSFWQATGVSSALAGQSVSTNRLDAEGSPGTLTAAQGRVCCVCVCVLMNVKRSTCESVCICEGM